MIVTVHAEQSEPAKVAALGTAAPANGMAGFGPLPDAQ
jgi:hypothetical protein